MKPLSNHLKEYWFLYAFCVQLTLTWGFINNSIKNHEARIEKLESNQQVLINNVSDIKADISSINTSLKFIEKQLQ